MPRPRADENRSDFIERCMGDSKAVSDFPDSDQRFAVCQSFWERRDNEEEEMPIKNGDQVRVNVRSLVNRDDIKKETRNGREVIVVPSATMPDDIVMNRIFYPANEIASSFMTLNQTPAPLGHPVTESGEFMSALDPEAINGFYFGAFNANARQEGGRVLVDKVIDVQRANESEMGRRVLEAIEAGDPIHTSTGLLCNVTEANEDDDFDFSASDILFDHDAILLDEEGAGTPEQGVGMLVNHSTGKKMAVINSTVDMIDDQIDYYGTELIRAIERREDASKWEQMKSAILKALGLDLRETKTNSNEVDMGEVTKDQFDELSGKVDKLSEAFANLDIAKALNSALEPITTKVDDMVKAQNADKDAKRAALVNKVVDKGILDEEAAKATPDAALKALLNSKGSAAGLAGGFEAKEDGALSDNLPEE